MHLQLHDVPYFVLLLASCHHLRTTITTKPMTAAQVIDGYYRRYDLRTGMTIGRGALCRRRQLTTRHGDGGSQNDAHPYSSLATLKAYEYNHPHGDNDGIGRPIFHWGDCPRSRASSRSRIGKQLSPPHLPSFIMAFRYAF